MPECSCRASTRLCSDGFPLKACGNDISKVLFSFCFQYRYFADMKACGVHTGIRVTRIQIFGSNMALAYNRVTPHLKKWGFYRVKAVIFITILRMHRRNN